MRVTDLDIKYPIIVIRIIDVMYAPKPAQAMAFTSKVMEHGGVRTTYMDPENRAFLLERGMFSEDLIRQFPSGPVIFLVEDSIPLLGDALKVALVRAEGIIALQLHDETTTDREEQLARYIAARLPQYSMTEAMLGHSKHQYDINTALLNNLVLGFENAIQALEEILHD